MLILFHGFEDPWRVDSCTDPVACDFTTDGRMWDHADAVVFHPTALDTVGGMTKRPAQCWVAWSMESDITIPVLADRAALEQFDITMTYQRSSDLWVPYIGRPILGALLHPPMPKAASWPVARVQSNPYDRSGRNNYALELMKHIKVASYGRVATTARWPTSRTQEGRAQKLAVIGCHKFTLAFENSVSVDYVTEKFFDPLIAGSVPVYLGAPNVAEFAPAPHSYIDTADFAGPAELAAYLNHLDRNDDDYQEYLSWKVEGFSKWFLQLVSETVPVPFRHLAEMVARLAKSEARGEVQRRK